MSPRAKGQTLPMLLMNSKKDPISSMNSKLTFELGMPHLGRNNLSESALLKVIGHHRWMQIQSRGGIPTCDIRDDGGERLYATFFFLEVRFSQLAPLSAFGENNTISFNTDLRHYEKVYLDGRYILEGKRDHWVRCSNVFIYQERGPSKLSLSIPATMDFSHIPALEEQPDSLDLCRQARVNRGFWHPDPKDLPLFEGEREFVYHLDVDRDLNGAGLVYFANFVSFLDLAEREILSSLPDPIPADILDARSTYLRRLGYFGNALATDRLHILLAARYRLVEHRDGIQSIDLNFEHKIRRSSDNKEIVISSCRKVARLDPGSEGECWAQKKGTAR
jgi:probable biosynthetic protein (TIGR04098 family)